MALVLLRHLFSPYPHCLWPYVSLALPLVWLNQEAGLSIPFAALPRSLFTGTSDPRPAGVGLVQRQWRHQRYQPRCLGEFLKTGAERMSRCSRQVVIWCLRRAHLTKVSQLLRSSTTIFNVMLLAEITFLSTKNQGTQHGTVLTIPMQM